MKNILVRVTLVIVLSLILHTKVAIAFEYPDRLQLLALLEEKKYTELEAQIVSAQDAVDQRQESDQGIAFILDTLANSNPYYEELLREWSEQAPDSYVPPLVSAWYYYDVAWSWRGHATSDQTSQSRLSQMEEYLQRSATELEKAIRMKPSLSAADALAIRILMLLGNQEFKEQTLLEALELTPSSYLVRASYLWSLKPEWGDNPERLLQFTRDLSFPIEQYPYLRPLSGYADYIFAESLMEEGSYEDALVHFKFAIEKGADHYVFRDLGINYFRLGNYDLALENFERSLELWPQNAKVLNWRARALVKLERIEEALEDLDLARTLVPMDRNILMFHAYLLRKTGQYNDVLKNYLNALYYNRDIADIWYQRGLHLSHEQVNFEAAASSLEKAVELDPERPEYWYEYAAVLHFRMDCNIVEPLDRYLALCNGEQQCKAGELKWASDARVWLEESGRCNEQSTVN